MIAFGLHGSGSIMHVQIYEALLIVEKYGVLDCFQIKNYIKKKKHNTIHFLGLLNVKNTQSFIISDLVCHSLALKLLMPGNRTIAYVHVIQ